MVRYISPVILFFLSTLATAEEVLLACIDRELHTAALKLTQNSDEQFTVQSYSNLENLQFDTLAHQNSSTLIMNLDKGLVILHDQKPLRLNALFVDGSKYQMQCNEVPTSEVKVGKMVSPKQDAINPKKQCEANVTRPGILNFDAQLNATNHLGDVVRMGDVITKPTLVYFGYTFCPDVCPLDTFRNDQVITLLKSQGIDAQQVFISVDVERDTSSVIRNFITNFENETVGLTGDETQIRKLTKALRVYYKKHSKEEEYFLIDHSTLTYLVLPQKGLVDFFRRDLTTEHVVELAKCHVNSSM